MKVRIITITCLFILVTNLSGCVEKTVDQDKSAGITGITVFPLSIALVLGGTPNTQQLTAEPLPEGVTGVKFEWLSENKAVASVSQTGLVTAEGVGSGNIVVTTKDYFRRIPVTVVKSSGEGALPSGVKGNGVHDDTEGLQALLDSKVSTVYLPRPEKFYLVSKTLRIHSGQTLIADRDAVIRLADRAGAHLLTNSDHNGGNNQITVIGGIWDGNNLTQMTAYHENNNNKNLPYDPDRYLGVVMMFDNVKNLHVTGVTYKDPRTFAFLAGRLTQFTIENITFDFNMRSANQDGIHLCGNSHYGKIANLKGACNDDMIGLTADEVPLYTVSRGPITDVHIDGIWAENSYRAVRLLSCGSPVKRIKISNIYGTFRNEAIILSNHNVRPGEVISTFEDISISGIFCTNSSPNTRVPHIRIHTPAQVTNLTISDYHRTETASATDNILVEKGAKIDHLSVSNASLFNQCNGNITFVNNQGTTGALQLTNIFMQSKDPTGQVELLSNTGDIKLLGKTNISVNGQSE